MLRVLLALAALHIALVASAVAESGGEARWLGSEAVKVTIGNGITSAVSLWRSPADELAELRILILRQQEATDATGVWFWVGGESHLLPCSGIESSFFRTEGFRSCFASFPGYQRATTISRCKLDWEASQRILEGASVSLRVDTEWKLLKRKNLSARQLARLTTLRPIPQ
jgi:hypothetical protein